MWWLQLVFGVVSALAAFLSAKQKKWSDEEHDDEMHSLEEERKAERVAVLTLINGVFLGISDDLVRFVNGTIRERKQQIAQIRQSVVDKICDLVHIPNARAAYYRIDDGQLSKNKLVMTNVAHAGKSREDEFSGEFFWNADSNGERNKDKDGLWGFDVDVLVNDVDKAEELLPDFDKGKKDKLKYRSFITISVRCGDLPFGMVTVNALENDAFTNRERYSVKALARLLAISEKLALSPQAESNYREQLKKCGLFLTQVEDYNRNPRKEDVQ
ncbi:hypothetical protein CS006_04235 [Bifidobacterium primatium]|uniref:GAF domain-containing protein n=1 Tax=Bifidobacterium primatium TaxID=2045438 RepID=A0A2M9H8Y2_9BIFI|nr:hypothetical protein CS006_04235 [Bifidobacterium primatium]